MKTTSQDTGFFDSKNKPSFPYGYLLIGLLAGCIGACFLTLNNVYTYLAIAMGVVMIVFSLVPFAQAILDKKRGFLFVFKLVFAILGIVAGIITLIVQEGAINVIANVLYLVMIIDGAYKVGAAIHSHKFYLIRFWVIAVLGSAILISAFLVSKIEVSPDDHTNVIHSILTGGLLIADGFMNILYAFFRSTFLIPDEFTRENKERLQTQSTQTELVGKNGETATDEGIGPSAQTPTPKPPQNNTVLTPPVIHSFDTGAFKE